jgi:hypothetical protein
MALLALGAHQSLLLIADGARWIRTFFAETLAQIPTKTMILDWYHLAQKCLEASSRICRGKVARAQFLRRLYRRLWCGNVAAAIAFLEAYRPQAKNGAMLETLLHISTHGRRGSQTIGSGASISSILGAGMWRRPPI